MSPLPFYIISSVELGSGFTLAHVEQDAFYEAVQSAFTEFRNGHIPRLAMVCESEAEEREASISNEGR